MLTAHSKGVSSLTQVFFPNNMGASILRRSMPGGTSEFKVAVITGTENNYDIDPSTLLTTDEIGCGETLDKIRGLRPD